MATTMDGAGDEEVVDFRAMPKIEVCYERTDKKSADVYSLQIKLLVSPFSRLGARRRGCLGV